MVQGASVFQHHGGCAGLVTTAPHLTHGHHLRPPAPASWTRAPPPTAPMHAYHHYHQDHRACPDRHPHQGHFSPPAPYDHHRHHGRGMAARAPYGEVVPPVPAAPPPPPPLAPPPPVAWRGAGPGRIVPPPPPRCAGSHTNQHAGTPPLRGGRCGSRVVVVGRGPPGGRGPRPPRSGTCKGARAVVHRTAGSTVLQPAPATPCTEAHPARRGGAAHHHVAF